MFVPVLHDDRNSIDTPRKDPCLFGDPSPRVQAPKWCTFWKQSMYTGSHSAQNYTFFMSWGPSRPGVAKSYADTQTIGTFYGKQGVRLTARVPLVLLERRVGPCPPTRLKV